MNYEAVISCTPVPWPGGHSFLLQEVGPKKVIEHWSDALTEASHSLTLCMKEPDHALLDYISSSFPLSKRVSIRLNVPSEAAEGCSYFENDGSIKIRSGETLQPFLPASNPAEVWFRVVKRWLEELETKGSSLPEIETQPTPGVVVGHHCRISPDTQLIPPCWIGNRATLRSCTIGPFAAVGEKSIVSQKTRITNSYVKGGTFVGEGLCLDGLVVGGKRILEHSTGRAAQIIDPSMLCPV